MKKLIIILFVLVTGLVFNGCDYIYTPMNHYVSIYNNEYNKYVTSVSYRDFYSSYGNGWSGNMISAEIYPYEYEDLLIEEGTYDFRIIMEDEYYSYEIYENSVYVNTDIRLDVCVDCYDKNSNVKVIKTAKEKNIR